MDSLPNLKVQCFGGPIAHYTEGWDRIEAWASRYPNRVEIKKWLPQDQFLPRIKKAHCGIWLDRDGVEPLLGSRTRALFFGWMGMDIIGSPSSELSAELQTQNILNSVQDAAQIVGVLGEIYHSPEGSKNAATQGYLQQTYSPSTGLPKIRKIFVRIDDH